MKQLALGVMQYTQDYDERLPLTNFDGDFAAGYTTKNIWDQMQPYLKSTELLHCPSAKQVASSLGANEWRRPQYGFPDQNTWSTTYICAVTERGVPLSAFADSARTCLIGETRSSDMNSYNTNGWAGGSIYISLLDQAETTNYGYVVHNKTRHLEGANYAYLDGHVKWLSESDVRRATAQQNVGGTGQGITEANASQYPIVFAWKK
jgi:prepilin-type processing-associated H-X9-DG protein